MFFSQAICADSEFAFWSFCAEEYRLGRRYRKAMKAIRWGSDDHWKYSELIILLMEEIRLTSWYGKYPKGFIHLRWWAFRLCCLQMLRRNSLHATPTPCSPSSDRSVAAISVFFDQCCNQSQRNRYHCLQFKHQHLHFDKDLRCFFPPICFCFSMAWPFSMLEVAKHAWMHDDRWPPRE